MTVFEEAFQEIESFGNEYNKTSDKIRVLTEYVVSDYAVDVATVRLEQKKDDTITDAQVSESIYEATEKCNGKLKKIISSTKRNSQDYFSKVNASLKKIVDDPSYQEAIDKAGELCKEYPKLGKVEVTYHAYEEEAKAIAKGMDELQKIIVKGKAKKNFTEADSARIDEIVTSVNKARQNAGKKDNKVTLTEGVSLLSALLIALKNQTEEKSVEGLDAPIDGMEPEASRIMVKAISAQKQLAKSNVAVNTRGALSLRNGIKKAIKQKKSLEKADAKEAAKETKESVELEADYTESSDFDIDFDAAELLESVFEELHKEPVAAPEPVEESAEDLEESIQDHLSYMNQLQEEILGYESAMEPSPEEEEADKILAEAAAQIEETEESTDDDDTTKEEPYNPEHSNPPEKDVPESVEDPEVTEESTEEPVVEDDEEPVQESTEDDEFDVDAMLAQAALESGIEPDENEVDALLAKYGVTTESEEEPETEEPTEESVEETDPKALLESFNEMMGITSDEEEEPEE